MKKYKILTIIYTCIFMLENIIFADSFLYNTNNKNSYITKESSAITTVATPPAFNFESASQILMESTTGKVLYANNENEKLLPASVTKIMTLLLIMEQIDSGKLKYTDTVTCSANAASMGGSQIWFKEGEQLSIDEALKAITVVSANDVTVAMSEKIGGSENNFVNMMNEKAKLLNMTNTNFKNSHGIDEEGHYTTAKDIAIMSRELITKHPNILKYTSIWMDSLRNGTFGLSSTNKLIRYYEGANGLKTGSTSQALFNLSATATRNNTTFISVIMKAPSSDIRLQETKQLLDYAFANYDTQKIIDKNYKFDSIAVSKNVLSKLNIGITDDITILKEKASIIQTDQKISINDNLTAPIAKNSVIGTIEIFNKETGEKIAKTNLIALNDIEKSNFIDYLRKIFYTFLMV